MTESIYLLCPSCGQKNRIPVAKADMGPKCGQCKSPLFPASPFDLDEAGFNKHFKNDDVPLLVDFWAPWCGPCQMMAPAYADAAKQMSPDVRFAKIDTEKHPRLNDRFGIRGIPLIILFHKGREVARQAGAMSAAAIVNWVSGSIK